MAIEKITKQTGEDVAFGIILDIADVPDISVLPQITVVLYYLRGGESFSFAFFAIDALEAAIVAEAAAESKTVNDIILDGNQMDMVLPKEDTDLLDLPIKSNSDVFAVISYFKASGAKAKVPVDPFIIILNKSAVQGLI